MRLWVVSLETQLGSARVPAKTLSLLKKIDRAVLQTHLTLVSIQLRELCLTSVRRTLSFGNDGKWSASVFFHV